MKTQKRYQDTQEIFGDGSITERDSEESEEVGKECSSTMYSNTACKNIIPVAHENKLKRVLHDNQCLRNEINNMKSYY